VELPGKTHDLYLLDGIYRFNFGPTMDTSMWNEETKKPRKSKKKSAEAATALQQPIPSITSTPTLNVTLDWLKPKSSHDAQGSREDCDDVPDDNDEGKQTMQNTDYEIISSHNDASLNLLQKVVRWIQPEKIRIIEPNDSSGSSGTSGLPSTTLPPTNVNGYELNLNPERNSPGVILDYYGNYFGDENVHKCTPVVYRKHPPGHSSK